MSALLDTFSHLYKKVGVPVRQSVGPLADSSAARFICPSGGDSLDRPRNGFFYLEQKIHGFPSGSSVLQSPICFATLTHFGKRATIDARSPRFVQNPNFLGGE